MIGWLVGTTVRVRELAALQALERQGFGEVVQGELVLSLYETFYLCDEERRLCVVDLAGAPKVVIVETQSWNSKVQGEPLERATSLLPMNTPEPNDVLKVVECLPTPLKAIVSTFSESKPLLGRARGTARVDQGGRGLRRRSSYK